MQVRLGWQAGMRHRLGEGERYEPDYPAPPWWDVNPQRHIDACLFLPRASLPLPIITGP